MKPIFAADNHVIDTENDQWKLRPSQEAAPMAWVRDSTLAYTASFGASRHLPESGQLPPNSVLQVVLGWQKSDESWHLGLVLEPTLSQKRNSRWCGLAYWPDPYKDVFQELAQTAAERLAIVLGVPFTLVPPEPVAPPPPPRPLPASPIKTGMWQIDADETAKRVRFVRVPKWKRERIRQILSNFFWMVVYAVVSLLTLSSDIDLPKAGTLIPNPQWLPYLGLGVSACLFVFALWNIAQFLSEVNAIEVDGNTQTITGYHNTASKWTIDARSVQSVYISEVSKKRDKTATTEHGEINLHLGGGKFKHLLQQDDSETNRDVPQTVTPPTRTEAVQPLTRDDYRTSLQVAGLWVGEALNLTVWLDNRIK